MSDLADCRAMELMYLQRAEADPKNSTKWLSQAERWSELARHEIAWRFQRRPGRQQMHAGPMAMGPNPVQSGSHWKQMG